MQSMNKSKLRLFVDNPMALKLDSQYYKDSRNERFSILYSAWEFNFVRK